MVPSAPKDIFVITGVGSISFVHSPAAFFLHSYRANVEPFNICICLLLSVQYLYNVIVPVTDSAHTFGFWTTVEILVFVDPFDPV